MEYKESGLPWIDRIPSTWNVKKGKYFMWALNRPIMKNDGIITCFRDGQVTLRSNRREDGFTVSLTETGYQGIEPGDLVVHGMDGFAGAIGISDSRGKATPVLNVLDSKQDKRYLMYLLRTMANVGVFMALSTGIRVRTCDTSWKKLREIDYICPPIEIQRSISRYLDDRCSEIDSLSATIQSEIDKLEEYKRSVITEAVTKGLDKNAEMKESGIEWIGKIPKHWKIGKVKYYFSLVLGKMLCSSPLNSLYTFEPYYSAIDVHFDGVNTPDKAMWFSPNEKHLYEIKNGDVLIVEGGAGAGGCALVVGQMQPTYMQNSIIRARGKHGHNNKYLCYWIESIVKRGYIEYISNIATIPHFTKEKIGDVPIPAIPIEEETEIISCLDKECSSINQTIENKRHQLTLLDSYKKSLIYEYVTGKKEVPSYES